MDSKRFESLTDFMASGPVVQNEIKRVDVVQDQSIMVAIDELRQVQGLQVLDGDNKWVAEPAFDKTGFSSSRWPLQCIHLVAPSLSRHGADKSRLNNARPNFEKKNNLAQIK
jgi:hypothetical protein